MNIKTNLKIILVLFTCSIFIIIAFITIDRKPLIGKWISKPGDGIGFYVDKRAPFYITFSETKVTLLDKSFDVTYKIKEKNKIQIENKNNYYKWDILILEDDRIQFYYPKIGLRRYQKID
jgi:hypothetical protein